MKKFLKIAAWSMAGIVLILLLGGLYFSMRIKPLIISQLNEQLNVKVDVAEVKISRLSSFPKLGVRFKQVRIDESSEHYNAPLLEAQELNLYINLFKLMRKHYEIEGLSLEQGALRIADLEEGSNYDIFKVDSSNTSAISFAIEKIKLKDCRLAYTHVPTAFVLSSQMNQAKAKLAFREDLTELRISGQLHADSIKQKGDFYLKDQEVAFTTAIKLLDHNSKLVIEPSELKIEEVLLNTEGRVSLEEVTSIDLKFNNQEADILAISSVLPSYIKSAMEHLQVGGIAQINGYFKGKIDQHHNPSFGFVYHIKDGSISTTDQDFSINKIAADGELSIPDLGHMKTAWVQCKLNQAASGLHQLKGDLHVDNFELPLIKWEGHASLDAPTLFGLMKQDNIAMQAGQMSIKGKMQLRYDTEKQEVVPKSFKYLGTVKGRNIQGKIKAPNLDLKHANFELTANDKHVVIKECQLKYNESSAELVGYMLHADELFNQNSNTEITGRLDCINLNINDFMSESESTEEDRKIDKQLFPYQVSLQTHIQQFHYNNFTAEEIVGTLHSNKRSFFMPDAQMQALEGSAKAAIRFTTLGNNYLLDINSKVQDINITQLFQQFDNFDQEAITADKLSGRLSGRINSKVLFDANFEPLMDKLYAKAEIEVKDGQLINYEPLQSLSNFVEVEELNNVKFTSLKNTIEIFDQTIFIPNMFIGNSALSLNLEGTHTFENYMDYHIRVNLAEILAKQSNWFARRAERRLTDHGNGGLSAHIRMTGTPDHLKITYDRIAVGDAVQNELREERENFRDVLRGESMEEDKTDEYYQDLWDE